MKRGARAVIIKNGKILLIHRFKNKKEYFVLPGGAIEKGETPKEAAFRELVEETGVKAEINELLWKFKEKVNGKQRLGYYFLVKSFKGKPKLGGPERKIQSRNNKYIFEWTPINKLKGLFMYPSGLKERIVRRF